MKNLIKIILPLALSFGNIQNIQNSEYNGSLSLDNFLKQKEIDLQRKKELYEKTIISIFPKLDSIVYMKDFHKWGVSDFWQTPKETDSLMTGDCEDKAIYTYDFLTKKGIDVKLCWGKLNISHNIGHIWNEYSVGNSVYIIETSRRKGCRILKKDTLDLNKNYTINYLNSYNLNVINDFEDYSGIKLEFKNPILSR
jgi:hypothetical protein